MPCQSKLLQKLLSMSGELSPLESLNSFTRRPEIYPGERLSVSASKSLPCFPMQTARIFQRSLYSCLQGDKKDREDRVQALSTQGYVNNFQG